MDNSRSTATLELVVYRFGVPPALSRLVGDSECDPLEMGRLVTMMAFRECIQFGYISGIISCGNSQSNGRARKLKIALAVDLQ